MRKIFERMLIRVRRADGSFGSDRASSCEDKRLLRDDVQALNEWIEMIGERLSGRPGMTPHSRTENMKRSNDRVMKALYDGKKPINDRPECV